MFFYTMPVSFGMPFESCLFCWRMTQLRSEEIHMQLRLNEESVYISHCLCFPSVLSMQRLLCSRNHGYLVGPEVMTIPRKGPSTLTLNWVHLWCSSISLITSAGNWERSISSCLWTTSLFTTAWEKEEGVLLTQCEKVFLNGKATNLGGGWGGVCRGAQRWKTNRVPWSLNVKKRVISFAGGFCGVCVPVLGLLS